MSFLIFLHSTAFPLHVDIFYAVLSQKVIAIVAKIACKVLYCFVFSFFFSKKKNQICTPIKFFKIIFLLMFVCVFTQVHTYSCHRMSGGQKRISIGHFPSTLWVLGIELRLSGLTANAVITESYCPQPLSSYN